MSPATLSLPFPLPTPTSLARHQSRQPTTITSAAARRPRHKTTAKTDNKEQRQTRSSSSNNSNAGFGGASEKKEAQWRCVESCGACCKLDKGPSFPSPQDIFTDTSHVEHYKSLIGPDGWCINYEKSTRKCSIYSERPYFCHVEPEIFDSLYGISEKKFNKEACSCCRDTIKAIYGPNSKELHTFNNSIWSNPS